MGEAESKKVTLPQAENPMSTHDTVNVERGQQQMSLLLDAFIVEYFEAKAEE